MNVLKDRFSNGTCDFEILAFPCHQFGREEPGKNEYEVLNGLKYVRPGYGYVPNFPLFNKSDVNGVNESGIYTFLKVRQFADIVKVFSTVSRRKINVSLVLVKTFNFSCIFVSIVFKDVSRPIMLPV